VSSLVEAAKSYYSYGCYQLLLEMSGRKSLRCLIGSTQTSTL